MSTDWVTVPRAALVHILDWHDKKPCGVGQESLDEEVFGALLRALHPGCPPDEDGTPCTLPESHVGDHENFYAGRTWQSKDQSGACEKRPSPTAAEDHAHE